MSQIVTSIVFAQPLQTVENPAIGHHRLNAQNLVARHAIAQHIYPTSIGGQQSADLRRAFRGQRQWKQSIHIRRTLLNLRQHRTSFSHQNVLFRITGSNLAHAPKA